jgi:hypothetical protein
MSHQLQATLQFSNALYEEGGTLPIFMESRGITGSLNVKGDYDTRFGLVKVVLEGKYNRLQLILRWVTDERQER